MYMMLLRELYGFLPVGDEDFVPLIIENSEEGFRPRASYPVRIFSAGMISGTA